MKYNRRRIRRLLACVLALLLALGELPVAAAATTVGTGWDDDCRGNPSSVTGYGKHKWVLQSEAPGNGCTYPGIGFYYCSYCGASTTHSTSAPGHKWGAWQVRQSPTCVSTGVRVRTCTVCGETQTESIARTDHTWSEWIVTKEATCAEAGVKSHTCLICGTTQTQNTAKADHSWGSWTVTKEATCQHTGTRVRTCRVCGKQEKKTIRKTAHHFGAWEVTLAATDHSAGERTHTCVDCGKTEKESFDPEGTLRRKDKGEEVREMQELLVDAGVMKHKQVNGSFNSATEKAVKQYQKQKGLTADGVAWPQTRNLLRHEWSDWVVTLEPTDFSAGKKARTCSICGMTKEEEFDPEGTLRPGDEGEDVRAMQIALKERGIFTKNTTGSFGPNTEAAVKKFQKQQGLTRDGIGWPGVLKLLGLSVQETPTDSPPPVSAESEEEPEEEPEKETATASMDVLCDVVSVPKSGDAYTAGETITWRLRAVNQGEEKVSAVVLTDADQKTALSDLLTELGPGSTAEALYTHEVDAVDVEMGSVSWFGYAKYMSPDGQMILTASPAAEVKTDGLRTAAAEPPSGAGASISLYSNGPDLPEGGIGDEALEEIGLKVVVEAGEEPLDNIEISLLSGGPVAVIDHLDAGDTEVFDVVHPLSDFEKGEGGIIDQAIMKFGGPDGKKGTVKSGMFKKSWKGLVSAILAALEAMKTEGLVGSIEVVNGPEHGGETFLDGETITFTVTIRNESDHPFYKVSGYFSQTARATEKRNYGTLNPGNEMVETYTRVVDGENIPDGHITAEFNIKAEYPEGSGISVNGGSVTVPCDIQNKYDMTVLLNPPVAKAEYHEEDEVSYQVYIANESDILFTDVTVTSKQMGKLMHRDIAAPGYSQVLDVTHIVTDKDLKQGFFTEQITLTCLGENNEERTVTTELVTILTPGKTNEELAESGLELCNVAMILKDTGKPANKEAYQEGEKVYLDLELVNLDGQFYEKAKVRIGSTGDWIPYPGGTIKPGADQHLQDTHVITGAEADEGSISIGASLLFWKDGQWYLCKAHPITLKTGTGVPKEKKPKLPGKHKPGHGAVSIVHDSDPEGSEIPSDSPEKPEGSEVEIKLPPEEPEKKVQEPMQIEAVIESTPANTKYYTAGEKISYTVTIRNKTEDLYQSIYLHGPGITFATLSVLWPNGSDTFGPFFYEVQPEDLSKTALALVATADYVDAAGKACKVKAATPYVRVGKDPEKAEEEKSGVTLTIKVTNKPKYPLGFKFNETIKYDVIAVNHSAQTLYVKISSLGAATGPMMLKSGGVKTLHASHKVTLKESKQGYCELTADMVMGKKSIHLSGKKVTADPVKVKTWLKGFHAPDKEEKKKGEDEEKKEEKKEDGSEEKKTGDGDKGIIVGTGKEEEELDGGAKQKGGNQKWKPIKSETPKTEPVVPTPVGRCCERVLTAAGDGSLTYELHLCDRHAAVAESVSRMTSAALTDEEKVSAWKTAAGLWAEEIVMQYETAAMNAADPAAKEQIREAAAAFRRMFQAMEADLDNLYPEHPEQAAQIMADMLKDHCVDLCIEIHTAPAARTDSLAGAGFTELTGSIGGEAGMISETAAADGRIERKIQLDSGMAAILRNIHALIRQVRIHPATYAASAASTPMAQVLRTAQDHWRKEIDETVAARYVSITDADELQALMANRSALLAWLDARKAMVSLLYPSLPEAAEEAAAKEAMKWLMYVRNPEFR